jgi:hypothetical protein
MAKAGLSVTRVKRGYLKQGLGIKLNKDGMRSALTEAGPNAYVEKKVDNGDSFTVTVEGKRYTIQVKTHFVSLFAEITGCPSAD